MLFIKNSTSFDADHFVKNKNVVETDILSCKDESAEPADQNLTKKEGLSVGKHDQNQISLYLNYVQLRLRMLDSLMRHVLVFIFIFLRRH